ncbi:MULTISPECIES: HDOD domain-containing protein [unclassified Nitratiruptor]|uniref:HDOD domain-containing protein n=1 Tax=unclassified Nitratiruptor TaxID=2624044 RepID=UPI0019159A0A|nr:MULTISPECIES: HDOD domain-containing protein [unclassified Nitratiruptor]BCD60088.1 hypothetical protein NitYY0810_C0853 [Nitratiruptor sp. YY08-10]BCD64423.1 hypothetical protein NitYY0814_C1268 [Nitratiruptor sp. YY08-14]
MRDEIIRKIRSLPPLPKTIEEFEQAVSKEDVDLNEVVTILQKDPMLVADILKHVNSPFYGLREKIEDLDRALSYLGLQEVRSIVMQHSIKKLFNIDMEPYGITAEQFAHISQMQSKLMEVWYKKINPAKVRFLKLAAFLQELGKIVIADVIIQEDMVYPFRSEIEMTNDIAHVEKSFIGSSTAEITGAMFEYWGFEKDLVEAISYADDYEKADDFFEESLALHLVKRAVPVNKPLHDISITIAKNIAQKNGVEITSFEEAIEALKAIA